MQVVTSNHPEDLHIPVRTLAWLLLRFRLKSCSNNGTRSLITDPTDAGGAMA